MNLQPDTTISIPQQQQQQSIALIQIPLIRNIDAYTILPTLTTTLPIRYLIQPCFRKNTRTSATPKLLLLMMTTTTTTSNMEVNTISPLLASSSSSSSSSIAVSSSTTISSNNNNTIVTASSSSSSSRHAIDDVFTIRHELVDLLSNMRGTEIELRQLEYYINTLEELYIPCQTIPFLNLMINGTWQFLFSSHFIQRNNTNNNQYFRLRDLTQNIYTATTTTAASRSTSINIGNVTNTCIWEWNQQLPTESNHNNSKSNNGKVFDCYGTFTIKGNYIIQSNGRILQCPNSTDDDTDGTVIVDNGDDDDDNDDDAPPVQLLLKETPSNPPLPEMILELLPKSTIPHNVTQLIQSIQRAYSQELFDIQSQTGYDITYMDDTIRIIRYYTPNKYNGIRNIFRRI